MSYTSSMESQNSTTKTLEYVQLKKGGGKAFVQGLISASIFIVSLLIVVLVYLPYIKSTKEIVNKRVALEENVISLDKKLKTISAYNRSDLDAGLKAARVFIPDEIRVAQLATFINTNAKQFNLEVSRLGINEDKSEVKQAAAGEEEKGKLLGTINESKKVFLGRVEGPFSFRGTRENIYKFLDFLVMGGFATNFDQVTLVSSDIEDKWSVSFFTSYYYLEQVSQVEPARPLLEVLKEVLKPISINEEIKQPTPTEQLTPTPTN